MKPTEPTAAGIARVEEVRFALVMNGGVSLAVWMGGVVTEIGRAVRERHPVYGDLLALTNAQARVDVICGTSAGGINGAALALALKCGSDVSLLRDVWQEKASFSALLRDPSETDPPSLLDGNGSFLPALEDAFTSLYANGPVNTLPLDLTLTATLLNARPKLMTDDLGTSIEDAEHRARFHFSQDDFKTFGRKMALRLAFAARATASFPIAFEPVYCKVIKEDPLSDDNYDGKVNFSNSRYLIDGGVLDNKPFEAALEKIFAMPVRGQVRRVLAYIVPDPGITATSGPDDPQKQPALASVAVASIFSIPAAETITEQLDQIKAHNNNVRRNRNQIVGLMKTIVSLRKPPGSPFPEMLFEMYYRHRVSGALDAILNAIEERQGIGRRTRTWIKELLISRYKEDGFGNYTRWVPLAWPAEGLKSLTDPADWWWGLYTVEFLGSPLLDLLRRGERMLWLVERQTGVSRPFRTPPPRENLAGPTDFADPDLPDSQFGTESAGGHLQEYWKRAYELIKKISQDRTENRKFWQARAEDLPKLLASSDPGDALTVAKWFQDSFRDPIRFAVQKKASGVYGQMALDIASLMLEIRNEIAKQQAVFRRIAESPTNRPEEKAEAAELLTMLEFLEKPDAKSVLEELLKLDVAQYAIGDRSKLVSDVAVELVQISGRSSSPLGNPPPLKEKLAGLQLGHFGAFYKRAWRANDWMHGRLDGSERLVHIILNPERLHQLYATRTRSGKKASEFVYDEVRRIAIGSVPSAAARQELEVAWKEKGIRDELAFLDDSAARVPERLDECCAAITRRLHVGILNDEIANVAAAAGVDQVDGAEVSGVSGGLIKELGSGPISYNQLISVWRNRSLGKEKIEEELGSDLMTRTLSQTVAVSHSVLSSSNAGLGPLRLLTGALHLPVRLFYLLSSQLLKDSKSAAAATVSLTTVGVLMILLGLTVKEFPVALSSFGWAVTAAGLGMALLRTPRVGPVIAALALIFTVLFLPFSLKASLAVIAMGLLIIALFRVPAIIGVFLVMGAAWAAIGIDGQEAVWTRFCQWDRVVSIEAVCSEHHKPLNDASLGQASLIGLSALTILGVWAGWSLFPRLLAIDKALRKRKRS